MEKIEISNFKELECGENSHQKGYVSSVEGGVRYEILSRNKELGYLDLLNLSVAIKISAEFFDVESVVLVKESRICAVALGANSYDALLKVIDCDPMSIFESTLSFSKEVTIDVAKQLNAMKIRNIMAPSFSKEAFSYLLETGINIVKVNSPLHELLGFEVSDIKVTPFGFLVQEQNMSRLSKETFNVVSQNKPTQQQAEDGIFAWRISKHLSSQSAVIAKDLATKAIIQGKTSSTIAVEEAMDYACENSKDAVLAIDSVIENKETINAAIQGRIGLIIESGDGKKSSEIVKLADKYGMSLIHTKIRNNKY